MGERRNAASLFNHSLKTPLASVKTACELLLKHLTDSLSEKDSQLLQLALRNTRTLEARINKILELSSYDEERVSIDLPYEQLEIIHDTVGLEPKQQFLSPVQKNPNPPESIRRKVVVHADPEIADLIPRFLENRVKDIEMIKSALDKSDFETIRVLGHSMKGAGGGYGFPAVTDIGKCLEDAAKICDAGTIKKGVEDLSMYLNSIEVIYDEP